MSNELGNTPADKNYKPSGIVNDLTDDSTKAVRLPNGTMVTEELFYQHKMQVLKMFLTWEDMKTIVQILAEGDWYDFEISDKLWSKEFYEEVLKRFTEDEK